MNTDYNTTGTHYPHQMSKEEFARWWAQINDQNKGIPSEIPQIIYLGQDSVEETE